MRLLSYLTTNLTTLNGEGRNSQFLALRTNICTLRISHRPTSQTNDAPTVHLGRWGIGVKTPDAPAHHAIHAPRQ